MGIMRERVRLRAFAGRGRKKMERGMFVLAILFVSGISALADMGAALMMKRR